jgi:rod shape-determining protein MreB
MNLRARLGVDLGTNEIVFFQSGKGIVLHEPTVVAVSNTDKKILSFGEEAREMLGKNPDSISAIRPIKGGVISDYKLTVRMLQFFINKVLGLYAFLKPDVIVSVPSSINPTERRAVIEAMIEAGAKNVYVVKEPVLAAIGSGVAIHEPVGRMVMNIGGGTTDIAVISLGGVVFSKSIKIAGCKFDESIINMCQEKHGCVVGERSAEMIKLTIGSAVEVDEEKGVRVRGRDFETGQPKEITVYTNEVVEAIRKDLNDIIICAKEVFAETPPELASDIMDNGILLTGSSANLHNIDKFLKGVLKIPVEVAQEPKLCVALGIGKILEDIAIYQRAMISRVG